jgi:hypothetical protein
MALALFLSGQVLAGELIALGPPSVVLGKITRQYVIKERPPCPARIVNANAPVPVDSESTDESMTFVCIDAWIGFDISTSTTLAGPKVTGRIRAARIQHAVITTFNRSKLFVLRPIEDALMRKAIKADFYLMDLSAPNDMYCLQWDPKIYGLTEFAAAARVSRGTDESRYCFELQN